MNKAILNPKVQEFIKTNLDSNLQKLILKGSPFPEIPVQELAVQIAGMKKAASKLPTWFKTPEIYYPPNINLEQTSSEITAKHKAALTEGKLLIDLTGGFGIDSFFFAERVEKVIHCEINPELSEIADHNFRMLGKNNIQTRQGDGIEILKNSVEKLDWIYLDPARRDDYGGKVFLLEQCTPDVTPNLFLFFAKADHILIKTSPLLDLTAGMSELRNVAEIHIVAVNNDVKELLWVLKNGFTGKTKIRTVNYLTSETQVFEAEFSETQSDAPLSLPLEYIYEPNPAVMKSGLFGTLAKRTNTAKLHQQSHLYTSKELVDFPGRSFKLLKTVPYHKKKLQRELNLKKANITTRNFPKSVAELRKEQKIEDGGDAYLFFTTNLDNEKIVLVCEKTGTE